MTRRGRLIPYSWRADEFHPSRVRDSALAAPVEHIFDEPCICLHVNVRWAAFVGGALHILEQPELWAGSEDDKLAAIRQVGELLDSMACTCNEPCDCSLIVQISLMIAAQLELTLEELDDGTIGSFAPGYPDVGWDADSGDETQAEKDRRQAALCWAVAQYIAEVLRQAAAYVGELATIIQVLGGILAFLNPPAGFALSTLGLLTKTFFQALIEDPAAVSNVICCMYDGLTGVPVSFASFRESISDCGFEFGSNEAQIAGVLGQLNTDETNYRLFVRFVAKSYGSVPEDFELSTCVCEECWEADLKCGQTECYEVIEGVWDCTSFDGWWENEKIASEEAIEITIRFPSAYIRRVLINTDGFLGQTNKVLKVYKGGDSSTGELVEAIPFEENFPVTREVFVEGATDQITWRVEVETVGGFTFSLRRPVICSRDLIFPLGECED